MSVINKMLQDLEQRSPEKGQHHTAPVINKTTSTVKVVIISLITLITLNALAWYVWSLQSRLTQSELVVKANIKQNTLANISPQKVDKTKPALNTHTNMASNTNTSHDTNIELVYKNKVNQHATDINSKNKKITARQVVSEKRQTEAVKVKVNKAIKNTDEAIVAYKPQVKPKMRVTRRQLSSKELVNKKLVRAEKAINTNHITLAEQLFEEVLIIEPGNHQARKKLAALWFGRKANQQAINLLSQGISLDQQASDLRMLKAKIQIKQGQYDNAHKTLSALSTLKQEDYQIMLANISQRINNVQSGVNAYEVLIKMQPNRSKWHLGLAIVYDQNSQFSLAKKEYILALNNNNLSSASHHFVQQRMQVLGE